MGSGRGTDGTLEGAELGDGSPSEGCSLHKGSRTEELKGGPKEGGHISLFFPICSSRVLLLPPQDVGSKSPPLNLSELSASL